VRITGTYSFDLSILPPSLSLGHLPLLGRNRKVELLFSTQKRKEKEKCKVMIQNFFIFCCEK
jgi:hypothetical protein